MTFDVGRLGTSGTAFAAAHAEGRAALVGYLPLGYPDVATSIDAIVALTEGVEKAFVSDIAPKDLRATLIGLHATFTGVGLLPASLFAGFLWDAFGPQATFYFGGAMGALAAAALLFMI